MHTLAPKFHISLFHNPKIRVGREHLRPCLHALQDLRLDLLVGIPIISQP